jgi:hypothetical protein
MSENSNPLVIFSKEHFTHQELPNPAMFEVKLKNANRFYAESMQSHNGFTVFTGCRTCEKVESTIRTALVVDCNGYHTVMDNGQFRAGFHHEDKASAAGFKCTPMLVAKTDDVEEVCGLSSNDEMELWARTDKITALSMANDNQKNENEKCKVKNSERIFDVVNRVLLIKLENKRKSMVFFKAWFFSAPRKHAYEIGTIGALYRECAEEILKNTMESGVEFDEVALEKSLGFKLKLS